MRRTSFISAILLLAAAFSLVSREPQSDPRLKKGARAAERNGWIQVHLEGTPAEIGYQHGYLLAAEIQDNYKDISTEMTHDEKKDWAFFRKTAQEVFWPHIEPEYREELTGIVEGLKAHGGSLDVWDIVAMNAWLELPYYDKWLDKSKPHITADHCSAFVATGKYTRDGRVVIGHNNWTSYASGERWNIMFDIRPAGGARILMDGQPGLIHSADDFGINGAGIADHRDHHQRLQRVRPERRSGVRARPQGHAVRQLPSTSSRAIMKDGNNGGYANNWLVADRKSNEVASLELGLKNVMLQRTRDGYFVGSNFPNDPKLIKEETDFDPNDKSNSENARHARWLTLMEQNKGKIDVAAGRAIPGGPLRQLRRQDGPRASARCAGTSSLSPRGMGTWQAPYAPAGAVQNKVTDAAGAGKMSMTAALGHACGLHYKAADHLAKHPEFAWYQPILHDMNARGWTRFTAAK